MAGSLDELIEYLLGEIALGGGRGLTFSSLFALVQKFYEPIRRASDDQNVEVDVDDATNTSAARQAVLVDRPFLAKLWQWLARHPDTSIGKEHQYDKSSLDDIEKRYPGYTSISPTNAIDIEQSVPSARVSDAPDKSREVSPLAHTDRTEGPRIYVNDQRISIAICGHPPDVTRVHPSEWELMLHIAAAGSKGIVQGDLVRASGQDKRSVPKRTDALHQKGYIEKRSIWLRGNKSSQLFLRKFAAPNKPSDDQQATAEPATGQLTIRRVIRQMFGILQHNPLIPQEDLRNALGMVDAGRAVIFSAVVRHFARHGCVKRIRTAFGSKSNFDDFRNCIQFLNDPDDDTLRLQHIEGFDVDQDIEALTSTSNDQAEYSVRATDENNLDAADELEVPATDALMPSLRPNVPSWNPDRVLANVLFEAAQNTGVSGMKNYDARNMITGPFIKRIMESLLVKISNRALQSQPQSLRHLAILRTQEHYNGILVYSHYSFNSFVQRVKDGIASWKEVSQGESFLQELKKLGKDESWITTPPDVDTLGFPLRMAPDLQSNNGRTTMQQLVGISKAKNTGPRAGEPVLRETAPGQFIVSTSEKGSMPRGKNYARRLNAAGTGTLNEKTVDTKASKPRKRADAKKDNVAIGRPRKFAPGTEKHWGHIFTIIIQQMDPDYVKKFGKSGITNDARALRIYHARPEAFDQALLQAIRLGFPIASTLQDISQRWVDRTMAVANRSEPGLYVTPSGYHPANRKRRSLLIVFRLPGLKGLDVCDRRRTWPWQQHISSAAHSHRYQRFYPRLGLTDGEVVASLQHQPQNDTATAQNDSSLTKPAVGFFTEIISQAITNRETQSSAGTLKANKHLHSAVEVGYLTDATDIDANMAYRSSEVALTPSQVCVKVPEPAINDNDAQQDQSGTIYPTFSQDKRVPALERPRRTRKSTQKVAENILYSNDQPVQGSIFEATQNNEEVFEDGFNPPFSVDSGDLGMLRTPTVVEPTLDETAGTVTAYPQIPTIYSGQELFHEATGIEDVYPQDHNDNIRESNTGPLPPFVQIPASRGPNMAELSPKLDTSPRKRSYSVMRASTESQDYPTVIPQNQYDESPRKRQKKQDGISVSRPQVAKLCRILVLELIGLCSGFIPNNSSTMKRAMRPRWQEAGITPDQLTVKTLRAAVKALCENGKAKQITFAFRNKSGIMNKLSILALPSIDVTNSAVLELQKSMITVEPADYTPPELEAEANRAPHDMNRKRYLKILDEKDPLNVQIAAPWNSKAQVAKRRKLSSTVDDLTVGQTSSRSPPRVQRAISTPQPEPVSRINVAFLTLKVPRIKELNLPPTEPFRFKIAPATVRLGTNNELTPSAGDTTVSKSSRRTGLRRKKGARFDPETHKLIWKKASKTRLPSNLDSVPNIQVSRDQAALSTVDNLGLARFFAEVDCVATWEEKSHALFEEERSDNAIFINHGIPHTELAGESFATAVRFEALIAFTDQFSDEIELSLPHCGSWPPFVAALKQAQIEQNSLRVERRKRSAREISREAPGDDEFIDDAGDLVAPPVKRQKRNRREPKARPLRRTKPTVLAQESQHPPLKRSRITRFFRQLSKEQKYQIVVAVIVVRTLAGGIEKFVDWTIVERLLPAQEGTLLKEAWKAMLNRYRSDVVDLTENLQNAYIEALTDGIVPSVNYDAVHTTDWDAIYKWALVSLDKSIINKIEDLPATRQELLRRNDYAFEEFKGLRELLGYNVNLTQPRKEETMSSTVFGKALGTGTSVALQSRRFAEHEETDIDLSRAKSWVMATLFTPEDIFDPKKIQEKLLALASTPSACETLLGKAVRSLQRDKLISKMKLLGPAPRGVKNRGDAHIHSLRGYEVSARFFEQFEFRRMVTASMLKQAADYKLRVLDPAFNKQETVTVARDAVINDGEMVAILNLLAMGMLYISPGNDVPANRWGLDWQTHGYTTRLIDKKVLSFTIILSPIATTYVYGDPLSDLRSSTIIPRGEIDQPDAKGRIPIWFDIYHNFQPLIWEMVLGATLGLISVRPGISTTEICRTFWHGLNHWEMQLILDWAERLHLIEKTSGKANWQSSVWWWMGVGVGVSTAAGSENANSDRPVPWTIK